MMQHKPLMRLFSLLALVSLLATQLLPLQAAALTTPPAAANSPAANASTDANTALSSTAHSAADVPAAGTTLSALHRPVFSVANMCGGPPSLKTCFLDGSDAGRAPTGITVFPGGTGAGISEPADDSGGLTAVVGDRVRVPFALANTDPTCPTVTGAAVVLTLSQNSGQRRDITTPTAITWLGTVGTLTHNGADETVGPTTDTDSVYGYFDFTVQANDGLMDNVLNKLFINLQLNASGFCNGNPIIGQNNLEGPPVGAPNQPERRIQLSGALFVAVEDNVPSHVSEGNSLVLPFHIINQGGAADFVLTNTVGPTNPGGSTIIAANWTGGGSSGTLAGGGRADGTVTIGPFLSSYGSTVTVTLTIQGKLSAGGNPAVQTLTWTIAVFHPHVSITKTSDKTLYKAGDTVNYTITIFNSGQLQLTNFNVLDSLVGVPTGAPAPTATLDPNQSIILNYPYTVKSTDSNPLPNTATVTAAWDPTTTGDTGPIVTVFDTTTHQVNVDSANLDVQFGANSPTPLYAKPGSPITGSVTVSNTGTQSVGSVTGSVQLVDLLNPNTIYATAGLQNLPSTVLAGQTLSPAPTFSILLPGTVPQTVAGVTLVVTINGVSTSGIAIHKKLTQDMDVVFSNLHVSITTDASTSGQVARGQVIHYTYIIQNISNAPVTGITISAEGPLGLLTTPITVGTLPANCTNCNGADTYVYPQQPSYTVTSSTPNQLVETVTASYGTSSSIGQSVLTVSDIQVAVGLNPKCTVLSGNCAQNITNNAISAPAKVRYSLLVSNTGQSTVTNVVACIGNAPCGSIPAPISIPLDFGTGTPGTLYTLGQPAKGTFDVDIPITQPTPFVQVVTITVSDQLGKLVTFRGLATLAIVSPNQFWGGTLAKTATVNGLAASSAFVGDTIVYTITACYKPTITGTPSQLTGVQVTDPQAPGGKVPLSVTTGSGTPTPPVTTGVTLNLNDCATGTYTIIADDKILLEAPGPIDLINTATITASNASAATAAVTLTIKLSNPIQITKTVSPSGLIHSGESLQYTVTITNASSLPISNVSATDSLVTPFPPGLPSTFTPGRTFTTTYSLIAPPVNNDDAKTLKNLVTIKGTINGVADTSSATSTITVVPALTVFKTSIASDNVPGDPIFIYDPFVTFKVTIKNVSAKPVKLTDAKDSVGALATPSVTGSIKVFINGSATGVSLSSVTLAPNDVATLSYTANPGVLSTAAGGLYTNDFTLSAQVGSDPVAGAFTVLAEHTTIIYAPIYSFNGCPDYPYYGWDETAHWHVEIVNGSFTPPLPPTAQKPQITLENLSVYAPALGLGKPGKPMTPNTLPFPTTDDYSQRPRAKADIDFKIPWNSPQLNFNAVQIFISFTIKERPDLGSHYVILTPKTEGCYDTAIGPPLTVTKTPSKANAVTGDVITYTVKVSNPMFDPADDVSNISAIDKTFGTVLSLNYPTGEFPGTLRHSIFNGNTVVSESASVTFTHKITASDPAPLINEVDVLGKFEGFDFPSPVKATATVTLPTPLLIITNIPNASSVSPGTQIIYDVKIQNNGINDVILKSATADKNDPAPDDPNTGLQGWIAVNGGTVKAGKTVTITAMYRATAPNTPNQTAPFTSTVTITYVPNTTPLPPPPDPTASGTATVSVDNPNLRMVLTAQPATVVNYGQTVTYTEKVINPSPVLDSNIVVTHALLAPGSDTVSNWKSSAGADLGPTAPTTLAANDSITRTVTHLVTTSDKVVLVFSATVSGSYVSIGTTFTVTDTKISNIIISSAQLLLFTSPASTQVSAGDTDSIDITITNIGAIAVNSLTVTVTLNDPTNTTATVPTLPGIPNTGGTDPNLEPNASTLGTYDVVLPLQVPPLPPLPANYPNPLIVTFTVSGTTVDNIPFTDVVTQVLLHVRQPNIDITETPNVSAAAVGSNVTYNISVTNPGPDPLNVTGVTDLATGQPVLLTYPLGTGPVASGTLQPNASAVGTTIAPIPGSLPNPSLHKTKADGTTAPIAGGTGIAVSDTSASRVDVLSSFLTVLYTTPSPQVPVNQNVAFNLSVTNTGSSPLSAVSAVDTDTNTPITLKFGGATVTTIAPGQTVTGVDTRKPTFVGQFTSHVQVSGTDGGNQKQTVNQQATVNVTGIQLAFNPAPTILPTSGKAGDTLTITFGLKNTASGATNDLTSLAVICTTPGCSTVNPALPGTLASGTSTPSETITYVIKPTDSGLVTLTLQATAAQASDPTTTTQVSATVSFNVAVGGLVLTKTASLTTAKPGDTITYTVNLKNTNATPITVTALSDTLAGNILAKLAPPSPIAAGATATATYTYKVPTTAPSTLVNTVAATFTSGASSFTAQTSASVAIIVAGGTLSATCTPNVTKALPGDIVTFTTSVVNTGALPLFSLSGTSSLGLASTGVNGTVQPGAANVVSFVSSSYTIPAGVTGTLSNTEAISASDASGNVVTGNATCAITIIGAGGLTVTKTASVNAATIGTVVTYTIAISNNGAADFTVTSIIDNLLGDQTAKLATKMLKPGDIAPPIVLTRTVLATDPADLRNTVTVAADSGASPLTQTAVADVVVITGSTGLVISGVPGVNVANAGDVITYTVTVTNVTSNVSIHGISASFTAPGGTPVSITLATTTLAAGAQTIGTFSYTTSGTTPNPLIMTLKTLGTDTNNVAVAGSSQTPPVVFIKNGIAALLTADQAFASAGGKVVYTLTITNASTAPLTSVSAAFNAGGTNLTAAGYNANALSGLPTTLAVGASTAISFTYTIQAADPNNPAGALNVAIDISAGGSIQTSVKNGLGFKPPLTVTIVSNNCATPCILRPGVTDTIAFKVQITNSGVSNDTALALAVNGGATALSVPGVPATLNAGASVTVDYIYSQAPAPPTPPNGPITLTFTANACSPAVTTPACAPTNVSGTSAESLTYTITNPKLSVSVPSTPPSGAPGSTVTIPITLKNISPTNETLYFNGGTSGFISFMGGPAIPLTLPSTPLAPTGTALVNYTYTIPANAPTTITYTVNVTGCPDPSGCTSTTKSITTMGSTAGTVVVLGMNVSISPAATINAALGQSAVFNFTLTNPTSIPITNLSTGVTVNGTAASETLDLMGVFTLPPNGSISAKFTHVVVTTDPAALNYVFTFHGILGGSGASNSAAAAVPVQATINGTVNTTATSTTPGLTVTKTANVSNVAAGAAVVFTIIVSNTGTTPLSNVTLTDTLPSTLVAGTATSDTGAAVVANNVLSVAIGTLIAGQKVTITLNSTVGTVTAPATIVNTACAGANGAVAATATPIPSATPVSSATSNCGSATLIVAANAATLPTTGFGGAGGSTSGTLFGMFALGSLLFVALAIGRGNRNRNRLALIVVGALVVLVVGSELISIGVSLLNKARSAPSATQVVAAAPTANGGAVKLTPTGTLTITPIPDTETPLPPGFTPPPATETPLPLPPTLVPTPFPFQPVGEKSIYIPRLGLPGAIPIIELPLINHTWDVSTLGHSVGHLEATSWVGNTGNVVLVAHIQLNYQDFGPFLRLSTLVPGDKVMVVDHGKLYTYQVLGSKAVKPTAVEVTYPTVDPILTLITCTTWDSVRGAFSQRLVVTAKLVQGPPSA